MSGSDAPAPVSYQPTRADRKFLAAAGEEGGLTGSKREARSLASQLGCNLDRLRVIINFPGEATTDEVSRIVRLFPRTACAVPFPFLVDARSNERLEPTPLEVSVIVGATSTLPAISSSLRISTETLRAKLAGTQPISHGEATAILAAAPGVDRQVFANLVLDSLRRAPVGMRPQIAELPSIAKAFPEIKRGDLSGLLVPENPVASHLERLMELLAFENGFTSVLGVAVKLDYSTERITHQIRTRDLTDLLERVDARSAACSPLLRRALGIAIGRPFEGLLRRAEEDSGPGAEPVAPGNGSTTPVPSATVRPVGSEGQPPLFRRRGYRADVVPPAESRENESLDDALTGAGFDKLGDLELSLGVTAGSLSNYANNRTKPNHPAVVALRSQYPRILAAMDRQRALKES